MTSDLYHTLRLLYTFNDTGHAMTFNPNLNLNTNSLFRIGITVDLNVEDIEIPIIGKSHLEEQIMNKFSSLDTTEEEVIIPLFQNGNNVNKRTLNTICKLFKEVSWLNRLAKVHISNNIYYIGKGIILDKDLSPLLLCTLKARKKEEPGEPNKIVYYKAMCYIHPNVFIHSKDLINKGIISTIIPFYLENEIYLPSNYYIDLEPTYKKVEIVIDDCKRFFTKPVKPKQLSDIDTSLNKCINDNIDEILDSLWQ